MAQKAFFAVLAKPGRWACQLLFKKKWSQFLLRYRLIYLNSTLDLNFECCQFLHLRTNSNPIKAMPMPGPRAPSWTSGAATDCLYGLHWWHDLNTRGLCSLTFTHAYLWPLDKRTDALCSPVELYISHCQSRLSRLVSLLVLISGRIQQKLIYGIGRGEWVILSKDYFMSISGGGGEVCFACPLPLSPSSVTLMTLPAFSDLCYMNSLRVYTQGFGA